VKSVKSDLPSLPLTSRHRHVAAPSASRRVRRRRAEHLRRRPSGRIDFASQRGLPVVHPHALS
jgi:hypothetical protein